MAAVKDVLKFVKAIGGFKTIAIGVGIALGVTLLAPILTIVAAVGSLVAVVGGIPVAIGAAIAASVAALIIFRKEIVGVFNYIGEFANKVNSFFDPIRSAIGLIDATPAAAVAGGGSMGGGGFGAGLPLAGGGSQSPREVQHTVNLRLDRTFGPQAELAETDGSLGFTAEDTGLVLPGE